VGHRLHFITFIVVLTLAASAQAQTFADIYNFTGSSGANPLTGVIEDSSGNLYGTTYSGGSALNGVVYEVSSSGAETVLYNFTGSADGGSPVAPVIRDSKGNLYGTAVYDGSDHCGVVFKLDTAGTETVLHSFASGTSDGCAPAQGLVMDRKGNLYGTTNSGGAYNMGTVFKLARNRAETLLHSFAGGASDGAYPDYGHLLIDKAGDLYGVTPAGGSSGKGGGKGVLYKLTAKGKLTLLHRFGRGADGCYPSGSVNMDNAGNLYGITGSCGSSDVGTVWKASHKGAETILHNFAGGTSDGCNPLAGVVLDSKGNLYGNTEACGAYGYGTVWKLSAKGTLTLLHSFDDSDGEWVVGELLRTAKGELLGTTYQGGGDGYGVVWSYVP